MPRLRNALARLWPERTIPPVEEKASRTAALIALETLGQPVWTPRDYATFAREGYMQNPVVYRSVRMIAEAAASVPLLLYEGANELDEHGLHDLIRAPSVGQTSADFFESWYGYLLVAGNAYAEAVTIGGRLRELHVLRPDRIKVVPGPDGWPEAYEYTVAGATVRIPGDGLDGVRPVLHVKMFHPTNDHYGLSPIEAAATAIDTHNTAANWNKALLDNSARPSGALVYGASDGRMTAEQFERLKSELETSFQGAKHAGRPLLLEGGLDWKPLSLSPKDMDFIEAKNAAAREIALAIGVPPMLLGIPGDNTYSNYQEAQRAFWRQTVLPLVARTAKAFAGWLAPAYGGAALELRADLDQVEALTGEREALWARLNAVSFLTANEKRAAVGYGPLRASDEEALVTGPFESPAVGAERGQTPRIRRSGPATTILGAGSDPFRFKYRPDQPRVPAGNSDGGQWVDEGLGGGASRDVLTGGAGDNLSDPIEDRTRVAGRFDTFLKIGRSLLAKKPKLPDFLVKKPRAGKITGNLEELNIDERRFVEELRDLGNDVELIPRSVGRTADFNINGKVHEYKVVSGVKKTDAEGISDAISSRILDARGQSRDIIIDARKQPGMSRDAAEQSIRRAYGADSKSGIDSITIYTPDGPIFAPRR